MRISTSTLYDANVATLTQVQANLLHTQQQVSTGRRILTPADDPANAARVLELTQSAESNAQFSANRNEARHSLSLSESTLSSVTSLLLDVRTSAVQAGDGVLSLSDKQALAIEYRGRLDELIGLANSTDGLGNYLFSGFQGQTLPFFKGPSSVQYMTDDGQRLVQVSGSRQVASSESGADVFMRIKNGNGTFIAQAAAANTGSGIISQGVVTNPALVTGHNYTIAFAPPAAPATSNIGNGTISTPTGTPATTDDYTIVFTSATTYEVYATTTTVPPVGPTLDSTGTYTSGQSFNLYGLQFNIQNGTVPFVAGDKFTVASSPGYTVTDTTNVPNTMVLPAAPAGRVPYVSGQVISFDGVQLDISGTPNNGDTFTISPSTNESIFQTISDLIAALESGLTSAQFTNNLNKALNSLDRDLDNILRVRASVGARLHELDALQNSGDDLGLQFKQAISQLQDVDYNKAVSDLTQQQINLEAAQKSFLRITEMSVFNYM
ncbi:MAG: flagellar hook-associated protein FlgL [Gallionellaceae bacterium]|nr:flagellar hook-associated protein FlgL [Gallionellaceae bacterium]